jgi:hypothetical protein
MSASLNDFPDAVSPSRDDEELGIASSRRIARIVSGMPDSPLSLRVITQGGDQTVVSVPATAFKQHGDILNEMAKRERCHADPCACCIIDSASDRIAGSLKAFHRGTT